MEVGKVKRWGPFSFSFFFLLFTFENDRNLFWVYQNGEFSTGKKYFTLEKKSGKCPLRKICLLSPCKMESLTKNIPALPLWAVLGMQCMQKKKKRLRLGVKFSTYPMSQTHPLVMWKVIWISSSSVNGLRRRILTLLRIPWLAMTSSSVFAFFLVFFACGLSHLWYVIVKYGKHSPRVSQYRDRFPFSLALILIDFVQ